MPYETLPARLREIIPARNGQEIFRQTFNSQLAAGKTEEVAYASAWSALQRAGYERNEAGKWVEKTQPTATQVHVDGPMNDEDDKEKGRKKPKDYRKASGAKPLYAYRSVLNAEQLHEWAREQGFASALNTDDMHVTVVYSRAAFSPEYTREAELGQPLSYGNVIVRGGKRAVAPLGDKGAIVLKIESADLRDEHQMFRRLGASWDYQEYTPHITITYRGAPRPARDIAPFTGDIVLGPLRGKPLNPEWHSEITEVSLMKRQMHDDAFTTPEEATVRSMDMGLGGAIHVHQTADGQAVYMPGEDHEDYLERAAELAGIAEPDEDEDDYENEDSGDSSKDLLETAISAIIETVMEYSVTKSASVLKLDAERRIAWGWASVSTVKGELVTDLQGDTITPSEMEKMADRFMASARTAKAMHEGAQTGEVLHSFPLTAELSKAFGLNADREGWIIGMKVHDDETWKGFVEGRYKGFSIGGKGRRKPKDYAK